MNPVSLVAACFLLAGLFWPRLSYPGESRGWEVEWERTLRAAKKEGQVVFYGASRYEAVFGEFQKKYPEIRVVAVTTGRPPELVQRMMTKRRAGKYLVDLYIAGASTMHAVLYKGKALDLL
jgi:ABC-type glycerol-3-phosphate transport system substrate-binding protein